MEKFLRISFIITQYLAPQHLLSRMLGKLADNETPWVKNFIIQLFAERYFVDMSEAKEPDLKAYKNFNAFFTRELNENARPIVEGQSTIASPADGSISQIGAIKAGRIFQAKGQDYSLETLLGGDTLLAKEFENGQFATVYLSPKDYHRVHMPYKGTLRSMTYVPGDLFSVNNTSAESISNLFARNERAVCIFDTELGPMAVILVGAMIVAGIETVWEGQVAPIPNTIKTINYHEQRPTVTLEKGEEMGRFKLGSTAIVLFGESVMQWQDYLNANSPVRMGEQIGKKINSAS